jgi:lipid A 3-O-deacylase
MSRHSASLRRFDKIAAAPPIHAFRIARTPTMMMRSRRLLIASAVLGCAAAAPAFAEERFASVLFQNDLFFGHDGGGYTNGIFASIVRVTSPGEGRVEPPLLMKPIAGWLGLPHATLASSSLGQVMVTPRDLTVRKPDPTDAPYVGALIFRSAQVYVHDDIADMAAVNIGVIGPAAGAEQTQRFVHRVVGADRPEGWDSQVSSKALVGIERYRAWRFPLGAAEAGKANGDFVALAGGALGNLETSLGGMVMLRYGVGLERSFPTVARVATRSADPFVIGRGWFTYAGLSADRIFNHVGISDGAPFGASAQLRRSRFAAVAGIAYGWEHSSLSFSLQSANPLVRSSNRQQSYGSVTYSLRMQ